MTRSGILTKIVLPISLVILAAVWGPLYFQEKKKEQARASRDLAAADVDKYMDDLQKQLDLAHPDSYGEILGKKHAKENRPKIDLRTAQEIRDLKEWNDDDLSTFVSKYEEAYAKVLME